MRSLRIFYVGGECGFVFIDSPVQMKTYRATRSPATFSLVTPIHVFRRYENPLCSINPARRRDIMVISESSSKVVSRPKFREKGLANTKPEH